MKKMMVLLASVLVLTACTQPKKESKEATANKIKNYKTIEIRGMEVTY